MLRNSAFGVLGLVALTLGTCVLTTRSVPAAERSGETSGQLTILDKKGRPSGVCPLKHTTVTADVAGYVSRVTVQQEFANSSTEAIEAVYVFPLPHDAAVDDMTMLIGKRVVRGRILRREDARQIYETARARGQAAALLDQERPNIFTQSVANIPPGETVKITLRYTNLLKYSEGAYEFTFPMVVGPRYVGAPSSAPARPMPYLKAAPGPKEPTELHDADRITPPITPKGVRAGHDISITVNLDAGLPLTAIRSTTHRIVVRRNGSNRAVVKLGDADVIPNKDFVLRYTAAGSDLQSGVLTYAPGGSNRGGYFTLILQPPMAPPQAEVTPKEMVFVIDQTGSQRGLPIAKAKETLRYCIRHLNPGDTFQVIGFNTQVYPCFDRPVPATSATIAKALRFIEPLEGNGGTDILNSVAYALKMPDDPDRLRIVCYMTDGYVGNDMQILDYIAKNRGRARMFPFGVGSSVNRFLIDGMAREGKGAAEYVGLNEDAETVAERFYRRVASPLLRDVEIDFGGLPVEEVYPKHIPDVFSAAPIVVKGRFTGPARGVVTVRGLLRGRPWSQTIEVNLPEVDPEHPSLATLWAREKVEDLQSQDWIGAQTGRPEPDIQEKIVAVALEYRLMTQYTSFVAVEERVVNVGGNPQRVDVPVEMPEGVSYEGIFGEQTGMGGPGAPQTVALGKMAVGTLPGLSESLARSDGRAHGGESDADPLAKLSAELRARVAACAQNPKKAAERVQIQIALRQLPAGARAKLKALGFELAAELLPGRLLLGTATVGDLKALAALDYVIGIRTPMMR